MCFIRINPSTAPLNPPGAAPTLTTIYDEVVAPVNISSSTITTSPASNPLSKETSPFTAKSKSRKQSNPFAAKAAKEGVVGTEKEKRRTQTIADSLDFGVGDLQVDEEEDGSRVVGEMVGEVVGEGDQTSERGRVKTVATETALLSCAP